MVTPPAPHPERARLDGLTGVRFLLALYVVLYHLLPWRDAPASPLKSFLSNGPLAVGGFFFLSGFILLYTYRDKQFSVKDFAIARFARIYPLCLLGLLIATFPRMFGVPHPTLTLRNWLLDLCLMQGWVDTARFTWNDPAWSLSVEVFLYAMFPLLCGLIMKMRSSRLVAVVCGSVLLRLVIAIGYAVWWRPHDQGDAAMRLVAYLPPFRLPEFLAGMALGVLFLRTVRQRSTTRLTVIGLACAIALPVCTAMTPDAWTQVDWASDLLVPALVLPLLIGLFWALTSPSFVLTRVLSWRPMALLGESSYALYILHRPIAFWIWLIVLGNLRDRPGQRAMATSLSENVPYLLIVVVIECAISVAVFRYLETPARKGIRSLFSSRSAARAHSRTSAEIDHRDRDTVH